MTRYTCFGTVLLFLLLAGPTSPLFASPSEQHYTGVVLDAQTKAPVAGVQIEAHHEPFAFGRRSLLLARATSRQDGSFDLLIPAGSAGVSYIRGSAYQLPPVHLPLRKEELPHKGQLCGYGGLLRHVSARHPNTLLISKAYIE